MYMHAALLSEISDLKVRVKKATWALETWFVLQTAGARDAAFLSLISPKLPDDQS